MFISFVFLFLFFVFFCLNLLFISFGENVVTFTDVVLNVTVHFYCFCQALPQLMLKLKLKQPDLSTGTLVGDFLLMFVYICSPLVGCGGPSGAESSTLSSYSSGIKEGVSQMFAKYSSSYDS